ncbi:30S ribosomal protein THX [Siphonobacter aquaeclarae]|jgi:ribosomal small subunit protein bTHX|nr:30S ribosomal protein THX [Siphonobacter aquaeclarae]MBO9639233.1 30S ribosomal protein THX [Siphonobacter aquaeclarae]
MGKGDAKSKKGKRKRGSYGKTRRRRKIKPAKTKS